MITLIIVDDQHLIRAGLVMLFDSTDDMIVTGQAADGVDAIRLAGELRPDIMLMDLHMPGLGGVQATRHIASLHPTTKILVLTTFDDDDHLYPALEAGASGFVVKDTEPAALIDAVRRTFNGDLAISPALLNRVVARALAHRATTPSPTPSDVALTNREREVLALVGQGLTNQEIADRLHLGITTVKSHVANLMTETGSNNRVRLALASQRML